MRALIVTVDIATDSETLNCLAARIEQSFSEVDGLLQHVWLRDKISIGLLLMFRNREAVRLFINRDVFQPLISHPICEGSLSIREYETFGHREIIESVVFFDQILWSTFSPVEAEPIAVSAVNP